MKLSELTDMLNYNLLSNDPAYNGHIHSLGVEVKCVKPDSPNLDKFIKNFNIHKVEILGLWKAKVNQVWVMNGDYNDAFSPKPADPTNYTIDDSDYEGFILGFKLKDEVEYIIVSRLCSSPAAVRKFIDLVYGLDGSNPDRKMALEVQSIIHQARQRVLGDKYNPDIMFTRLV
ncbi:hypothetical protein MYO4S_00237 [Serratia phage 4S]|nr:hypothetical protein MYO4S_00237 [Serratia phage 4S]